MASDGSAGLVRIHDPAGRPRGTGFLADHHGTLVTSHEAVQGLLRLTLRADGDRVCLVGADAVTPLPEHGLALVRTDGLDMDPLPISARDRIATGTYVRLAAGCWREARVLGAIEVTYPAEDRDHHLPDALELAIGTSGRDALRQGGGASGGPVIDADTGAVLAVLGTMLRSGERETGFAVPLRAPAGPLADLLARNTATVPAYGADLNPAGALELTATALAQDAPTDLLSGRVGPVEPVGRAEVAAELDAFAADRGTASVLGLVGGPGSGRTTELAALARRLAPTLWSRGADTDAVEAPELMVAVTTHLAPALWLRGADLSGGDHSVADAVRRSLARAARIVAASRSLSPEDLGDLSPERLAARTGRPLLLLLDGPEEMPPALARRLREWTEGTARWLRATGARLVIACREEYWEEYEEYWEKCREKGGEKGEKCGEKKGGESDEARSGTRPLQSYRVRLAGLTTDEAHLALARHGIPDGVLTDRDTRHPLTLRLLAEVRAALPDAPNAVGLDRHDVLSAHVDLMCLRVAVRLAAGNGLRGTAVRRLAARVAGQLHEAARRSLVSGQGTLDRDSFEELFPRGWASAVLSEGLLLPATHGYRFAHEELADWIQGMHLDLDDALRTLIHSPASVPRHRVGPVVQALLGLARRHGTRALAGRLEELIHALDTDPASWWAARLLARTLLGVPDATPYTGVLRLLATHIVARRRRQDVVPADFGPGLWTSLAVTDAERHDLLRRLVLADRAPDRVSDRAPDRDHPSFGHPDGGRYLDAVARLLAADPAAVQPRLTRWFEDERPLPATPHATVATAAQALLYTHRHGALDALTEVLADSAHRRADELLAVLAEEETPAVCRAVDRWAHDERPSRRAAAVTHGLRAAPHIRTEADRELLRDAALTLLARPADQELHGGALALLVREPRLGALEAAVSPVRRVPV